MDCNCIRYTHVPNTSPLFLDYLYHFDRVANFYNGSPFQLESYEAVAAQLPKQENRHELADILLKQNKGFGCEERTLANIGRLRDPGTFAVVTGQQVGLFSGPAFTIYKALTAVRLAQWLSEEGLPSVPVFWLATEDHDLEEVAQTAFLNTEYELVRLADPGVRPAPQSSVGYVRLSEQVNAALDAVEHLLPGSE